MGVVVGCGSRVKCGRRKGDLMAMQSRGCMGAVVGCGSVTCSRGEQTRGSCWDVRTMSWLGEVASRSAVQSKWTALKKNSGSMACECSQLLWCSRHKSGKINGRRKPKTAGSCGEPIGWCAWNQAMQREEKRLLRPSGLVGGNGALGLGIAS